MNHSLRGVDTNKKEKGIEGGTGMGSGEKDINTSYSTLKKSWGENARKKKRGARAKPHQKGVLILHCRYLLQRGEILNKKIGRRGKPGGKGVGNVHNAKKERRKMEKKQRKERNLKRQICLQELSTKRGKGRGEDRGKRKGKSRGKLGKVRGWILRRNRNGGENKKDAKGRQSNCQCLANSLKLREGT